MICLIRKCVCVCVCFSCLLPLLSDTHPLTRKSQHTYIHIHRYNELQAIQQETAQINISIQHTRAQSAKYKSAETHDSGRKLELSTSYVSLSISFLSLLHKHTQRHLFHSFDNRYAYRKRLEKQIVSIKEKTFKMKKSLIWFLMEVSTFVNSVASTGVLSFGSVLKNLKPPKSDVQGSRAFEEIVVRSLLRMNELWLQQLKEQRKRSERDSRRGVSCLLLLLDSLIHFTLTHSLYTHFNPQVQTTTAACSRH